MRPPVQPTRTPAQRQSVVVVGGGFAGLRQNEELEAARLAFLLKDNHRRPCRTHASRVSQISQPRRSKAVSYVLSPDSPWTRPPIDDSLERPTRILVPSAAPMRSFDDCLGHVERHV